MTTSRGRIIVIGGSIAGLFAGILLRRLGWQVDIYERASEALASRGAGITTHDELYAAFSQAGVTIPHDLAVASRERVMLDRDGNEIGRAPMPQWMTSWGLLYRFLRERFPDSHYHLGANLLRLEQSAGGVEVEFEHGQQASADYLIGADGLRSAVRTQVMPEARVRYVGYCAWRGLAEEAALDRGARELASGRFLLCLPPGEHMLGYMVAGPGDTVVPGQRWYNWVWYRPAPAATALRDLLTDSDGIHYAQGIPHHLIRQDLIDAMRADAARLIAPQLRAAIAATPRPFLQPIHELASSRLVDARVIVIGDAAFTARPHIGLGVSKAADDAAQLARAFAHADDALAGAITAWEQRRLAFGRAAVEHSARLGCYLDGTPARDAQSQERQRFYRSPEVVMAQIAARNPYQFLDLA